MPDPIKYVAEPRHVREVSLLGTADLELWRSRLETEGFVPTAREGRAQILIIAADMQFMGVRFQELSVSVLTEQIAGMPSAGAFLLQAFNSCRLFAYVERRIFGTPYDTGEVTVATDYPALVELKQRNECVVHVQMDKAMPRMPSSSQEDGWSGPVFLPSQRGRNRGSRYFFAKVSGHTRTYPFSSDDMLTIRPGPGSDSLQHLIDSNYKIHEWMIRDDAIHGKSKTFKYSAPHPSALPLVSPTNL